MEILVVILAVAILVGFLVCLVLFVVDDRLSKPRSRPPASPNTIRLFAALVVGPILFTVATFYLVVPIFALVMGGPLYLGLGFPVLLVTLRHAPPHYETFLFSAVATVVCLALVVSTWDPALVGDMVGFSLAFAALWSMTSCALYRRWTRTPPISDEVFA